MADDELQPKEALSTSNDVVQETPEPEAEAQGKEQDQESQAQDQASDHVPEQANPQQEKKNRKSLLIALGVIAIAAVILIGIFVVNIMESDSAKNAITNTLPENPAVIEQVIPSTWGDQTGFTVDAVKIREFDRGLFASSATAVVEVQADNGSYQLRDTFDIWCEKQGSSWSIARTDLSNTKYWPIGPVANDALLAHLPEILAKADEPNEHLAYVNPLSAADFFSVDTEAQVLSTEYEEGYETASIKLVRMVNDEAHVGNLDVTLMWDAALDQPDWKLDHVWADENTDGAMGSVVRDGLPANATESDQEEIDVLEVADDHFYTQFQKEMSCMKGSLYCFIGFTNISSNTCDIRFSVLSNETGEVLYESPVIEPGQCLDYFSLAEPLEPGNHSVTVQYTAIGDGWRYIDTTETDEDCSIYTNAGVSY